jgi:hypothetical protein
MINCHAARRTKNVIKNRKLFCMTFQPRTHDGKKISGRIFHIKFMLLRVWNILLFSPSHGEKNSFCLDFWRFWWAVKNLFLNATIFTCKSCSILWSRSAFSTEIRNNSNCLINCSENSQLAKALVLDGINNFATTTKALVNIMLNSIKTVLCCRNLIFWWKILRGIRRWWKCWTREATKKHLSWIEKQFITERTKRRRNVLERWYCRI